MKLLMHSCNETTSVATKHEITPTSSITCLDGLSSQDDKVLCTLHEEAGKLVAQNLFNLVGLLDADADAHRVDGELDKHLLVLIATDGDRVQ